MLEVVAAVIENDGLYLACRRNPDRGGRWEFPGGKIEPGERSQDAIVREVREELAVEIAPEGTLTLVRHGTERVSIEFIRARLLGERPTTSTDHDQLAWLALSDLMSVEWAEADRFAAQLLVDDGKPIVATIGEDDA